MAHRDVLPHDQYRGLVAFLYVVRAHGRCEYCGGQAHDPDHAVKRAQGGADTWDNLLVLCRSCHRWRDESRITIVGGIARRGLLRVSPLGEGRFRVWIESHRHVWAAGWGPCCWGWKVCGRFLEKSELLVLSKIMCGEEEHVER